MKINCLIIDDEPIAREILETYIADCPALVLVKSCKDAFEATEIINRSDIQLLFLDINMPKLSGMKFYKSLTNPPFVIFTTAYPEFAVEGFEVEAIDYLLKPFPFERFLKAVNKALDILKEKINPEVDFIFLKADKKIHRISLAEIYLLEAVGDYVKVFFEEKYILVHDTFQGLLNRLPEKKFFRIHKSYAIALDKFEYVEGNRVKIKGQFIPISQTYRPGFMELIKTLRMK